MPNTTIQLVNSVSQGGTITVKNGTLQGERARSVVLEATPATGYVFDKWEIETTPINLRIFAIVGQKYNSIAEVCTAPTSDLTTTFYTDSSQLYSDVEGKYLISTGYWFAGSNQYYFYNGNSIPTLQTCETPVVQSSVTSGGGGFVQTGRLGGFDEENQSINFEPNQI
jgi:hypothetical protein